RSGTAFMSFQKSSGPAIDRGWGGALCSSRSTCQSFVCRGRAFRDPRLARSARFPMRHVVRSSVRSFLLVGLTLGPFGLGMMAEAPPGPAQTPGGQPAVGAGRAQGAAPPAPGRGGRGGRGGPQATDPANEGVDFSPRDPVL